MGKEEQVEEKFGIKYFEEEIRGFKNLMMQYECAMLEVKTKLEVLNKELSFQNRRNPFESIKCRIKTPESIFEKLNRNHLEPTLENIETNLKDIAGIRVICSFPDDIYTLADSLVKRHAFFKVRIYKFFVALLTGFFKLCGKVRNFICTDVS